MNRGNVELFATTRFLRNLKNSTGHDLIWQEIEQLKEFLQSKKAKLVSTWPEQCKPINGTKKNWPKLYEWRMSIRSRLIFTNLTKPVLVDFDLNHESVDDLIRNMSGVGVRDLVANAQSLNRPRQLEKPHESPLLQNLNNEPDLGSLTYVEEYFDDWVHFLDEDQEKIRDQILNSVLSEVKGNLILLLGGAGTGKTSVLTNLAFNLDELGIPVSLRVNAGVRSYLASGKRTIPGLNVSAYSAKGGVLLIDDPLTLSGLGYEINSAISIGSKVVIGIDPTQWHQRRLAENWDEFKKTHQHEMLTLTNAYRQNEGVGAPALQLIKDFFNRSSAFIDYYKVAKEHEQLRDAWEICLEQVEFKNSGGGISISDSGWGSKEFKKDLKNVVDWQTERSWPKLLIGHEQFAGIPVEARTVLDTAKRKGLKFHQRSFGAIDLVRGTEYDFVVLFIPKAKWLRMKTGKKAAGTKEWESLNTTLTFLTRAKNHVFVYLTDAPWSL